MHAFPPSSTPSNLEEAQQADTSPTDSYDDDAPLMKPRANGFGPNGYPKPAARHPRDGLSEAERRRAKDAEEFELDALISESEDEDRRPLADGKRRATGHGRNEESSTEEGKVRLR